MSSKKNDVDNSTVAAETLPHEGMADRSLRGIKWNYVGVLGRIVAQLLAQIALARMVGPDAFGIFSASMLTVGIAALCLEMGLGSAIVQAKNIDDSQIRHAFTCVVLSGAAGSIILFLAAGMIANFFETAPLKIVLQVMAPTLLVGSFCIVSQALLQRNFEFKTLQAARLSAYIISHVVIGNVLAWIGAGVWSLVAAWYLQIIVSSAIFFWKMPHPVAPIFFRAEKSIRHFGTRIVFTNIINWVSENLDKVIIGKGLGSNSLGLYSVPYNLVRAPANHLVMSLQTVLLPASAYAQNNVRSLQLAYLSVVAAVTLVAFPTFIAAATISETLIEALFGHHWAGAAALTIPLALAMPAHSLMALAGPMLAGKGEPGIELKVQFWTALLFIAALLVTARQSVEAVAWTVFSVYLIRSVWITIAALKIFKIPFIDLFRALQGACLLTLALVPALFVLDRFMTFFAQPAGYRLLLEIILGVAIAVTMLFAIPHRILSVELKIIVNKLASQSIFLNDSFLLRRIRH